MFLNLENLKLKKGFKEKLEDDLRYLDNRGYLNYIEEIYLFGSCSKNQETYLSDIDLGIILNTLLTRHITSDIRGEFTDPTKYGIETNAVFVEKGNIDKEVRLYRK